MERFDVEFKFATDEAGLLSGYASAFGGEPDSYGDVIEKGAFTKSLAEHKAAGSAPLMLWQHKTDEPVGRWLDLREDETGLAVTGRLILETQRAREAYALLKGGALNGLSIGYRTRASERRAGGGRTLQDLELIEISLVSVPAATRARVTGVKTAQAGNPAAMGAAVKRSHTMAVEKKAPAPEAGTSDDVETRVAALEESVTGMDVRLKSVEESVGNVAKSAERIEQKLNRPGAVAETKSTPEKIEAKAFTGFLRHGRETLSADEVKTLRVADDTSGGYLAPRDFVAEVIKGIVEVSPVRQAARVGATASGSVILPRRTGKPTASWVGETEARTETGSTYGQVEIPVHEMSCYVDVSLRLLEDAAVNVESEVASDLAEEFGRLEGNALVNGNGVKKPSGFMADAAVSYTPTGNASTLGTAPADTLITLMYALPAFYRNGGVWMMNGNTLAAIRKLKDGQQNFLWQPSYQAGQPETILGRPVIEAPDMPDIGSAAEPIAFGDFARAYRIYDRVALSVMRDPYSQATSGVVRFHARRRVGGGVVLAEAIRKLRCATS
jgi:HK97 family phage major capsid protein/HK97 family phage prohead protease